MDFSRGLNKLAQRYPTKRVLITGATSGLGEALAIEFASAGWRVVGPAIRTTGRAIRPVRSWWGAWRSVWLPAARRRGPGARRAGPGC